MRSASIRLAAIFIALIAVANQAFSQTTQHRQRIFFISDVQAPLPMEKIIMETYRNEEARDSLFADIRHQQPENLFLLGDLISRGSDEKAWTPVEKLVASLKAKGTKVYAIPGNHEYMGSSSAGIKIFSNLFNERWLTGYAVNIDSIAIVMINSNFKKLDEFQLEKQASWYKAAMDSLESSGNVKAIIVCTHHAPYSNSKIVGSSEEVQEQIVPVFERSGKSKLFISGHSHNLEYFSDEAGKHFLVIGGGGGIKQPLLRGEKSDYTDLLDQEAKPLYFYLVVERTGNSIELFARGFKKDFRFFEFEIGTLSLNVKRPAVTPKS